MYYQLARSVKTIRRKKEGEYHLGTVLVTYLHCTSRYNTKHMVLVIEYLISHQIKFSFDMLTEEQINSADPDSEMQGNFQKNQMKIICSGLQILFQVYFTSVFPFEIASSTMSSIFILAAP